MQEDAKCVQAERDVYMAISRSLLACMCFQSAAAFEVAVPVSVKTISKNEAERISNAGGALFTWRAKHSCIVTLIKDHGNKTVAFLHGAGTMWYVKDSLNMGRKCPVGTAILAQIVIDTERDGSMRVNALVFDIMKKGCDDSIYKMPPEARYAELRSMWGEICGGSALKLQWMGHMKAASDFCLGDDASKNIPHQVDCVMCIAQSFHASIILVY